MEIAKISDILLIVDIQVCVVVANSSDAGASEYVILPWKVKIVSDNFTQLKLRYHIFVIISISVLDNTLWIF